MSFPNKKAPIDRVSIKKLGTRASIGKSDTRASVKKSDTRAPVKKSGTRAPVKKSGSRVSIKKSGSRASIKKSSTRASIKKSGTRASVKKSGTHASIEKSGARASIKKSGNRAPVKKSGTRASIGVSRLTLLAMLLVMTLIAGWIERSIPFDFVVPGVKLGIANVVILFALYKIRPGEVFLLVMLKCVLTSVFMASFTSLIYSACGSLLSFTAMAALIKWGNRFFSPIGISVVGAICHNIGQILAASFVLGSFVIVSYLPVLLISGTITGILVGIAVSVLVKHVALRHIPF